MPDPTTLYLIRHGEAAFAPLDPSPFAKRERRLTAGGREQIRRTAETLKGKGIAAVFTSPRTRTRESAGIIEEACGASVREDTRLRIGSSAAELEAFLSDVRANYPGKTIAIVSHLDTLSLLRSLLGGGSGWFPGEGESACLPLT